LEESGKSKRAWDASGVEAQNPITGSTIRGRGRAVGNLRTQGRRDYGGALKWTLIVKSGAEEATKLMSHKGDTGRRLQGTKYRNLESDSNRTGFEREDLLMAVRSESGGMRNQKRIRELLGWGGKSPTGK